MTEWGLNENVAGTEPRNKFYAQVRDALKKNHYIVSKYDSMTTTAQIFKAQNWNRL